MSHSNKTPPGYCVHGTAVVVDPHHGKLSEVSISVEVVTSVLTLKPLLMVNLTVNFDCVWTWCDHAS